MRIDFLDNLLVVILAVAGAVYQVRWIGFNRHSLYCGIKLFAAVVLLIVVLLIVVVVEALDFLMPGMAAGLLDISTLLLVLVLFVNAIANPISGSGGGA